MKVMRRLGPGVGLRALGRSIPTASGRGTGHRVDDDAAPPVEPVVVASVTMRFGNNSSDESSVIYRT